MQNQDKKVKKSPKTISLGSNKYKILYQLGKGSQGKVYCVQREGTGQYFAMKVCKPTQLTANEILVHKNCNCSNIVSIIQANKVDDKIYIILELGECNLQKYIAGKHNKRLDEEELFRLIRDVGNGLSVIHKNNYIHHDIKLTNIIMNFDLFKIADFGVSVQGEMKTFRGTPFYLAPQCLEMKTKLGACDSAIDIWALGVVVFESCFDMHPLYTKNSTDLDYFKKQIEHFNKTGYSFKEFKNALKNDQNTRKLKKFEDVEKELKNKDVLEYFFSRVFVYEPTQRLKLQQIPMILSRISLSNGGQTMPKHQVVPRFMSQPTIPSHQQIPYNAPLQRLPSFGSTQTIESPTIVRKNSYQTNTTLNSQPSLSKATIIEFLSNTVQIMKRTLGSYPNQLNIGISAINNLIMNYQSNSNIDYSITQASILSIYTRLGNLIMSIPGLFFRLLIIAYLSEILKNYQVFVTSMEAISSGEVKTGDFRQYQQFGSKIDVTRLSYVTQLVKQLR